jgi:putative colanic acid biosynthesis acetyltransferase WcaF
MSQDPASPHAPVFQRLDQTARYPYTPGEYARRFAWRAVEATLVRFSLPRCYGWRRFWLRRFGAKLADTSRTRPTTRIFHPWLLTMGEHSALADGVNVYNLGPVTIGRHTVVSQGAELCGGTHDYTQPNLPLKRSPITIGSGVWLCAQAFIAPGVVVGDNAVVGARAVATSDVPGGMVMAGNPAVVVKPRPMG